MAVEISAQYRAGGHIQQSYSTPAGIALLLAAVLNAALRRLNQPAEFDSIF